MAGYRIGCKLEEGEAFRRMIIPGDLNLWQLHKILVIAYDLGESKKHCFRTSARKGGPVTLETMGRYAEESKVPIREGLDGEEPLYYHYRLGGKESSCEIVVEENLEEGVSKTSCLAVEGIAGREESLSEKEAAALLSQINESIAQEASLQKKGIPALAGARG